MSISKRLVAGPLFVLILLVLLVSVFLKMMDELSYRTTELYDHPYTVSNVSKDIKLNILDMSRDIRDLVLKLDSADIYQKEAIVKSSHNEILREFSILKNRYLGDKNDILELETLYRAFYQLVEEELRLIKDNRVDEAQKIIIKKGEPLIHSIVISSDSIIDFAEAKGVQFINESVEIKKQIFNSAIIILVIALVFILIISFLIRRSILLPIGQLTEHLEIIERGEISEEYNYESSNEISALGFILNTLSATNERIVKQVKKIAKGNFDVKIQPRSSKDELVISINEMSKTLNDLKKEQEKQNWLVEGQNKIYSELKGENDINRAAKKIVTLLCEYLGFQVGALFLNIKETSNALEFVAGYSYFERKKVIQAVHEGEGLVGQVFKDKERIMLTEPPDNYSKIKWSFGFVKPEFILLEPLVHEGNVIGVFELATINKFDEKIIQFIDSIRSDLVNIFQNILQFNNASELLDLLEKQRNDYRQVFDALPFPFRIIDINYNSLYVNKGFAELVGKDYKEINQLKCHEVLSGESCHTKNCPVNLLLKAGEKKSTQKVVKIINNERKVFRVLASKILDRDKKKNHIVEIFIPEEMTNYYEKVDK
jgi:CHASE3 domain sensor protein